MRRTSCDASVVEGKPVTCFRKPEDRKAEDAEKAVYRENSEPAEADDPEGANEIA